MVLAHISRELSIVGSCVLGEGEAGGQMGVERMGSN